MQCSRKKRYVFFVAVLTLLLSACSSTYHSETSPAIMPGNYSSSNQTLRPFADSKNEEESFPVSDAASSQITEGAVETTLDFMKIEEYDHRVQAGEKISISEVLYQFPDAIDRGPDALYLKQDLTDGKTAFIFYGKDGFVTDVFTSAGFPFWNDMMSLEAGKSTFDDVIAISPNYFLSAVSRYFISGHVLQDGICIITCSTPNSVIESIQYITDEEINCNDYAYPGMIVPYILPEDKATSTGGSIEQSRGNRGDGSPIDN